VKCKVKKLIYITVIQHTEEAGMEPHHSQSHCVVVLNVFSWQTPASDNGSHNRGNKAATD